MDTLYSFGDMIELVLLGGFLGMIGAVIHEIPDLARSTVGRQSKFRLSRFAINLLVGFGAGCIGVFFIVNSAASRISHQDTFTLVILGYAAGDFGGRIINVITDQDHSQNYAAKATSDPFTDTSRVAESNKQRIIPGSS